MESLFTHLRRCTVGSFLYLYGVTQTKLFIGDEVVAALAPDTLAISLCAYCIYAEFISLLVDVGFVEARRYFIHFVESIFKLCFKIGEF